MVERFIGEEWIETLAQNLTDCAIQKRYGD